MSASRTPKPEIAFERFSELDIRCGRVLRAEPFQEARRPAVKLWIDFGEGVGVLPSSAQLTRRYDARGLVDSLVLGLVNLPPLRVAGFRSECLVLGLVDPDDPGDVVLARPDPDAEPGDGVVGWTLG